MASSKDLKLLWGRAAGRCSICRIELSQEKRSSTEIFPIGESSHIVAEQEEGPRGEGVLSKEERNSYHNLILLCPNCHTLIDKNVEDFPPERLYVIKSEHELWVQTNLGETNDLQDGFQKLKLEQLVRFVKEWLIFCGVYQNLHNIIEVLLLEDKTLDLYEVDLYRTILEEFHQRKNSLRKQLFLLGEEILITQEIPDWEILKAGSMFIYKQGYKTPFSCILDIKNPVASINLHQETLWMAHNISYEFVEYLSFTNKEIATILIKQREKEKEILNQWSRNKVEE